VQGATIFTRGASGATTGGLANPVVATAELIGSIFTSVLAVFVPIVAILFAAMVIVLFWKKVFPKIFRRAASKPVSPNF
jgi:hypothetical protein